MKLALRIVLLGSIAIAGAACTAAPGNQAAAAAQSAPTPAAAAQASPMDGPATSNATTSPPAMAGDTLMARAKISRDTATQTALAQVPNGTVQDAELEEENQLLIWSFDIATPDSKDITEIQVDAVTGKITSTQVETPTDQSQEAATDNAGH